MQIKWRLRLAAAHREVWTGAQLRRLLAERSGLQLSSASVSALLTRQPATHLGGSMNDSTSAP